MDKIVQALEIAEELSSDDFKIGRYEFGDETFFAELKKGELTITIEVKP